MLVYRERIEKWFPLEKQGDQILLLLFRPARYQYVSQSSISFHRHRQMLKDKHTQKQKEQIDPLPE